MNAPTPITLPPHAMCVEYNLARILFSLHYDLYRRDDQYLWLLQKESETGWRQPREDEKPVFAFPVEQGFFSDIWDGNISRVSYRCEELIYMDDFLRALARVHSPEFRPSPIDCMGRGRRTWHVIGEYYNELLRVGVVVPPTSKQPEKACNGESTND